MAIDSMWHINMYKYRRAKASRITGNLLIRLFVFNRDGKKCKECGSKDNLTIDHIISVYAGGSNSFDNLQTLCSSCNSRKAP